VCLCSRRESEGGEEKDEDEEESSGWERAIDSKSRKSSGAGGVGVEEEEEGSKRQRRIDVRGGPVEGEREEGGEVTLTHYGLIMPQLIAQDRHDPTASLPAFLAA